MKYVIIFSLFIFAFSSYAQEAQNYFPDQPGYKWTFKVTPLDTFNNKVEIFSYIQIDSFAVTEEFQGKNANILLSKSASQAAINVQPYTDTNYVSLSGTEIYEYVSFANIDLGDFDSIGVDLPALFDALRGWYSVYRLESPVNSEYSVFSKDTTVEINETSLPLNFGMSGNRMEDEIINNQSGTFNCKKFLITRSITAKIIGFDFPILAVEDTVWMAPGNYIIKDVMPSSAVDLSALGFGNYFIPGFHQELAPVITDINEENLVPAEFSLSQNYPNPFNPETIIKFSIPTKGFVTLDLFNILGRKIATLINNEYEKGEYSILFNAENYSEGNRGLASGIYFYRINFNNRSLSNKMMLIK